MSFTSKAIKIGAIAVLAGVAIKVGKDKYRQKKREYARIEEDSKHDLIRKYTSFFDRKLVEIEDGPFEGCELKSFSSKLVLDLSRAVIDKDVYVTIDVKGTSLTIILPEGQGVRTDINSVLAKVTNHLEGKKADHTVYIIGKAWGSNIEIAPEYIYMDNDVREEYEDFNEILGEYRDTAEE